MSDTLELGDQRRGEVTQDSSAPGSDLPTGARGRLGTCVFLRVIRRQGRSDADTADRKAPSTIHRPPGRLS